MRFSLLLVIAVLLSACQNSVEADFLIKNGQVFVGDNTPAQIQTIAIQGDRIIYVGSKSTHIDAPYEIDADGLYVLPGFIDPHTHSMDELQSEDSDIRANINYLTQGVTTVVNGNDGFGDPGISKLATDFNDGGIGTNTALFIGHGALRESVMARADRAPRTDEMNALKAKIRTGMEAGALGLSTGLFYAPGSFSDTDEVIELSKVVAEYGGIYDSHIRDEATYNIGLEAAVAEVIEISKQANIHANIAHIKALGVDVWGKSDDLIDMIENAHGQGLSISADQYPWQASGTRISNALLPRWVKAGTTAEYMSRLSNPELLPKIRAETKENLRKRGGPSAVLITQNKFDWQNKTLGQISKEKSTDPVEMAIEIARSGDARIASFNMNARDIENFMSQPWVMTSSDGSTGHPRKFASYPQKYTEYVRKKNLMPVETFFYRSSGLVADTIGICDRGYIRKGYFADIVILSPEDFTPNADFRNPEKLSDGVVYNFVNGIPIIKEKALQPQRPGRFVPRCQKKDLKNVK